MSAHGLALLRPGGATWCVLMVLSALQGACVRSCSLQPEENALGTLFNPCHRAEEVEDKEISRTSFPPSNCNSYS